MMQQSRLKKTESEHSIETNCRLKSVAHVLRSNQYQVFSLIDELLFVIFRKWNFYDVYQKK